MEKGKHSGALTWIDKLFGGLPMGWPALIGYAVGAAAVTALFLILPLFKNSSFERMGVTFEAWIFLAILIMANCKKPLESACKTFVFFLVSQPLIYLLQVPFSWLGWGLFQYYGTWFIWTLLTFPMAYVGWYITRRNWLSVLILSPILAFLGYTVYESAWACRMDFPHLLFTALFCLAQIILYVLAFFPRPGQKAVGLLIPAVVVAALLLRGHPLELSATDTLPGAPALSEEATITVEDASIANVQLINNEEARVYLNAQAYGSTVVTVTDGELTLRYLLEISREDGATVARFSPAP